MSAPLKNSHSRGFSPLEILIGIAMISMIVGFAVLKFAQGRGTASRTNIAVEFANYLQKARLDSMRRNARDMDQMAQVKVFNRKFYSVALDADGDGQLDIPLVMSFPPEQDVEIDGPFPKTFIFDWQGQTVDAENRHIAPEAITVTNGSGASTIRFTETGNVVVGPGSKSIASK
jgi:type II secretory pathway pseudopilin PulG